MTWFRAAADERYADARGALVRVLTADRARTAGAGVYLCGRRLLTCAHVVNAALGQRMLSARDPGGVTLDVTFPVLGAAVPHRARLVTWIPPRSPHRGPVPDGSLRWEGDLAVLELAEEPPPPVRPVRWLDMARGQEVRAWYGGGQPFTYADVRVAAYDDGVGYLDGQLTGAAVDEGYSGGPLWSLADGAAVGLVMGRITAPGTALSAQHTVRRSWGLGRQTVLRELRHAGAPDAGHLDGPGGPAHRTPPAAAPGPRPVHRDADPDETARDMMVGPLQLLLGDPAARAAHATALAAELGLGTPADGTAPSVAELAELLTRTERALPTLAESLAPALADDPRGRGELDRLLALGRLTGAARLLSVAEHRLLRAKLEHLCHHDPGLLHRAATAALPYLDLPGTLHAPRLAPAAVAGVLGELETWPGDSSPVPDETPRLPALLRVVEYVAAETGGLACRALQEWSGRVAARLGIHASALRERRADAARWSQRTAPAGARILVELDRHAKDPADHYRCAVWRLRADGSAARAVTGPDRPRPGPEIARLVRDIASGTEGAEHGVALVAVSVPPDALELPVDEWDGAGVDEYIPAPLGEDFHLILRCPRLRRRSRTAAVDLARRWEARHRGGVLHADRAVGGRAGLIGLLKTTHRDTARVLVRGTAGHRGELLPVCLVMGVPIVLWDRASRDAGPELDAVAPDGPVDGLPERVRHFRVHAYADTTTAARPALVWEDTGMPLPDELQLADPAEGPGQAADGKDPAQGKQR
ncbi:trypsin-like peptidase domain-containing protein [Streptomyces sp. CC224B]|uniref:VMAP-C domain-containing protein n=1 Tax=Streptomyces sp. CC224B TaxID=3044571 RepID=UPI0024A9A1B6|nr:trypsin-like peptidase domain-containing protein [Streptomyces sp. CC224B]